MRLHCIELPVPSLDEAGRWLESVLHFLPVDDGRLYVCGNFRLRLVTAEGDAPSRAPDKIVGLEHIALETPDAGALLRALLSKGLELEHDRGVPFFNPKVFGTGTKYFNLIAPFGTNSNSVSALTRTTHPTLRKYSVWSTSVFPRTILPHHSGS